MNDIRYWHKILQVDRRAILPPGIEPQHRDAREEECRLRFGPRVNGGKDERIAAAFIRMERQCLAATIRCSSGVISG